MAFLIYKVCKQSENLFLETMNLNFKLAGYNMIYDLWKEKGCPINVGWQITRNELSVYYQNKLNETSPLHFIIDFDPGSKSRIGLIEIIDIYIYTVGNDNGVGVAWNPLMFRMQDIYYDEFEVGLFPNSKEKEIEKINYPPKNNVKDFVEFLYLNGDKRGWNWGRNGMTNAAFIQGKAREYFRQYF